MSLATQPVPTADKEMLISGCAAIAQALRLASIDVVTAYPIRPYDTVMQAVAKLIASGELDAEYIVASSEHDQFEIVKHASAVGARVFCGSSGVGWMYAMEAITVTPALRLPMVALVGNRALDDPGAFGCEHNDALSVRDLGWMLTWVDTAQEALDTALIAYRVAEDPRIFLPCAIAADGAFLTHSEALVKVPSQQKVDQFLPKYNRGEKLLHPDNPITVAPQANEDWVMEIRKQNDNAMRRARGVIEQACADYSRIFGRQSGNPFVEEYMTADAEVILFGQGTLSMPVKVGVRKLREQGHKVGFVRLRWFRPFPTVEIQEALGKVKAVGVIDRDYSFGSPNYGGVLYNEVRSALYDLPRRPAVVSFVCGLGGREVTLDSVTEMSEILLKAAKTGRVDQPNYWIGVRG
ncbi:MAG TPA: pyruvate ferredoxin oxidoreductase [Candidatus Methylomirabilis sp.]|nr:pyruvate ferredoxin oxidoreductase [Candidatus Methylomirabilis sp.]